MTPLEYFQTLWKAFPALAEETDYPKGFLARTFAKRYLTRHVWLGEYRSLKLYECSEPRFREYLIYKESERLSDRLNAGATTAEIDTFQKKERFNAAFRDFIRRDWIYLPDSSAEEIDAFLAAHETVFLKACSGSRGAGISLLRRENTDAAAFRAEYGGKDYLLEAPIVQHPALAAVNPGSVNTVRFIAARHGDHVCPVGAGLRTGGGGEVVDNFHHGGTAYPLDLETGIVTARGIDLDGHPILRHPVTGHIMPGFQVPHWDAVLDMIRRAAVLVPHIGYVGWDVAVTEDGPELIEGNINYPGNTIIQLDGPGARKRLVDFCAAEGIPVR